MFGSIVSRTARHRASFARHVSLLLIFVLSRVAVDISNVYSAGSVTVVSFLRLASVKDYATTSNPTWDQWDIVWWSTIELEVGFICTCLPTMRLILVRMAPKAFGSSQSTNSSYVTVANTLNLRGQSEANTA